MELELQELVSNAKHQFGAKRLASFSHNPKVLYHHLQQLSKLSEISQCLVYHSSPILDPIHKVEPFVVDATPEVFLPATLKVFLLRTAIN